MTVTVNTLAQASLATYGTGSLGIEWKPLTQVNNTDLDYQAQAWVNTATGELIIANRGTDPSSGQNLLTDAQLGLQLGVNTEEVAQQFAVAAYNAAVATMANAGSQLTAIYTTGHSLGASEGQFQAAALSNIIDPNFVSLTNVSFDAPGMGNASFIYNPQNYNSLNISAQSDLIHNYGGSYLPGTDSLISSFGPANWQTDLLYDGLGLTVVSPFLGLPLAAAGGYYALQAHSMSDLASAIQNSALGNFAPNLSNEYSVSQLQNLASTPNPFGTIDGSPFATAQFGMPSLNFYSEPIVGVSGAGIDALASAEPPPIAGSEILPNFPVDASSSDETARIVPQFGLPSIDTYSAPTLGVSWPGVDALEGPSAANAAGTLNYAALSPYDYVPPASPYQLPVNDSGDSGGNGNGSSYGGSGDDGYGGSYYSGGGNDDNGDGGGGDDNSGGGDYSGGGGGDGDGGGDYGGGGGYPVILALPGNSIKITPLTSSNMFFDMSGSGYKNHTAWAGAGNAVLFYDPNNTNAITQANQIVFTDWDPSATSDMQALEDVFDTNHDGVLNGSDADWSDFKLMVTNADGTTSVETLAQAGITSINLTANATNIVLPDGSSIDGETTYTYTSGTTSGTGTAATVTFAVDPNGYVVTTTSATNADGSETITNSADNADGSLAYEQIQNTLISSGTTTTTSRTLTALNNGGMVATTHPEISSPVAMATSSLMVWASRITGERSLMRWTESKAHDPSAGHSTRLCFVQ